MVEEEEVEVLEEGRHDRAVEEVEEEINTVTADPLREATIPLPATRAIPTLPMATLPTTTPTPLPKPTELEPRIEEFSPTTEIETILRANPPRQRTPPNSNPDPPLLPTPRRNENDSLSTLLINIDPPLTLRLIPPPS